MRQAKLTLTAFALLLAGCAPSVHVESLSPPDAPPPRSGETYAWRAGSGGVDGDLQMADNAELDRLIKAVIDEELSNRGFRRVEGESDLTLAYVAAMTRQLRVEEVDELFRYRRRMYVVTQTEIDEFDLGSLVLDVNDGSSGDLLWRGAAEAELHSDDRGYREARLRQGVEALIAELASAGQRRP